MDAIKRISLNDFVKEVKKEIRQAMDTNEPMFEVASVQLEVAFELDVGGSVGFNLWVLDCSTSLSGKQVHKVTLDLKPIGFEQTEDPAIPEKTERLDKSIHQKSARSSPTPSSVPCPAPTSRNVPRGIFLCRDKGFPTRAPNNRRSPTVLRDKTKKK